MIDINFSAATLLHIVPLLYVFITRLHAMHRITKINTGFLFLAIDLFWFVILNLKIIKGPN